MTITPGIVTLSCPGVLLPWAGVCIAAGFAEGIINFRVARMAGAHAHACMPAGNDRNAIAAERRGLGISRRTRGLTSLTAGIFFIADFA